MRSGIVVAPVSIDVATIERLSFNPNECACVNRYLGDVHRRARALKKHAAVGAVNVRVAKLVRGEFNRAIAIAEHRDADIPAAENDGMRCIEEAISWPKALCKIDEIFGIHSFCFRASMRPLGIRTWDAGRRRHSWLRINRFFEQVRFSTDRE